MGQFLSKFATLTEYVEHLDTLGRPNITYIEGPVDSMATAVEYNSKTIKSILEENKINIDGHMLYRPIKYNFGDVILYNTKLHIYISVSKNDYIQNYKGAVYYVPQCICVIPTGLIDNKARFISLSNITTNGILTDAVSTLTWMHNSANSSIYIDIGSLNNFTNITPLVSVSDTSTTGNSSTYARTAMERNPSKEGNSSFKVQNIKTGSNGNVNTNLWYYDPEISQGQYTLPIFNDDWSLNTIFYNANNITGYYFNDHDGKSNTQILINIQSNPELNKLDGTNVFDFPAATACYKYSTAVFKAGEWFLPSITELVLGMIRFDSINELLDEIASGESGIRQTVVTRLTSGVYWSSTEFNSYYAAYFTTSGGYIYDGSKYNSYHVRAFLSL